MKLVAPLVGLQCLCWLFALIAASLGDWSLITVKANGSVAPNHQSYVGTITFGLNTIGFNGLQQTGTGNPISLIYDVSYSSYSSTFENEGRWDVAQDAKDAGTGGTACTVFLVFGTIALTWSIIAHLTIWPLSYINSALLQPRFANSLNIFAVVCYFLVILVWSQLGDTAAAHIPLDLNYGSNTVNAYGDSFRLMIALLVFHLVTVPLSRKLLKDAGGAPDDTGGSFWPGGSSSSNVDEDGGNATFQAGRSEDL